MTDLNFVSYNVRGLGNNQKWQDIFHYVNLKRHNVIYMQETHSDKVCIVRN